MRWCFRLSDPSSPTTDDWVLWVGSYPRPRPGPDRYSSKYPSFTASRVSPPTSVRPTPEFLQHTGQGDLGYTPD